MLFFLKLLSESKKALTGFVLINPLCISFFIFLIHTLFYFHLRAIFCICCSLRLSLVVSQFSSKAPFLSAFLLLKQEFLFRLWCGSFRLLHTKPEAMLSHMVNIIASSVKVIKAEAAFPIVNLKVNNKQKGYC